MLPAKPDSHMDFPTSHSTHHTPALAHLFVLTCCSSLAIKPCVYIHQFHAPSVARLSLYLEKPLNSSTVVFQYTCILTFLFPSVLVDCVQR